MDTVKSLEAYLYLEKLPNYSLRLDSTTATAGKEVDIVPSHGDVSVMATPTRAATGKIEPDLSWSSSISDILPKQLVRSE